MNEEILLEWLHREHRHSSFARSSGGAVTVSEAALVRLLESRAELRELVVNTLAGKIAVIAHNCQHKEPDQLTDQERIAIAIIAGASWEMTEHGVRVTDAFAIVKNDGKFTVGIRKSSTKYPE